MDAITKTLQWRKENLWPTNPLPSISQLHCFPNDARDPLGRPIILIQAVSVTDAPSFYQSLVLRVFEQLRVHLASLGHLSTEGLPVLQYVVLLDLKQVSMSSLVSRLSPRTCPF